MKTTRDDLVIRAMALAHMVNQYTSYCVFINYSGHVQSIDITIGQSKKNYLEYVLQTEFYTAYKEHAGRGNSEAELQAKIEILTRILRENDIPFDDCQYTEELVREYTF